MMELTMTPTVSIVRSYDEPGGYAARRPYRAAVTVMWLTPAIVYLMGAKGEVCKATWWQLLTLLRDNGVKTVMMERHGKMKTLEIDHAPTA